MCVCVRARAQIIICVFAELWLFYNLVFSPPPLWPCKTPHREAPLIVCLFSRAWGWLGEVRPDLKRELWGTILTVWGTILTIIIVRALPSSY